MGQCLLSLSPLVFQAHVLSCHRCSGRWGRGLCRLQAGVQEAEPAVQRPRQVSCPLPISSCLLTTRCGHHPPRAAPPPRPCRVTGPASALPPDTMWWSLGSAHMREVVPVGGGQQAARTEGQYLLLCCIRSASYGGSSLGTSLLTLCHTAPGYLPVFKAGQSRGADWLAQGPAAGPGGGAACPFSLWSPEALGD